MPHFMLTMRLRKRETRHLKRDERRGKRDLRQMKFTLRQSKRDLRWRQRPFLHQEPLQQFEVVTRSQRRNNYRPLA